MSISESREEYNKYMREYHLRQYYKIKNKLIILLGGICVKCGGTDNLQFDHIDRLLKKFDITSSFSRPWFELEEEAKKCQLLCMRCHNEKTAVDQGKLVAKGTHGTLSSYRYCKCDSCKAAKSQWQREYIKIKPRKSRSNKSIGRVPSL